MRTSPLVLASIALLMAACGGPPISKQQAAVFVQSAPALKATKLIYLPRTVAVPADGISSSTATREGEAMNIIQIASVDPVVAVLRARDRVTIEDFVSAVQSSIVPPSSKSDSVSADSTKAKGDTDIKRSPADSAKAHNDSAKVADSVKHHPPPAPRLDEPRTSPPPMPPLAQQWIHTLRITPRVQLETEELAPDDGDDNPESPRVAYTPRPITRTPGWTLAIGTREFIRILDVSSYTPSLGEPKGEARVDFLWRWRATKAGSPFDTQSAEFQSLPTEVQQAALSGGVTMDTSSPHWSRAILAKDGATWKVTNVDWHYGDDKPHNGW